MDPRFVFVGNRRFVLEQMLECGIQPSSMYVIASTHLEKDFLSNKINGVNNYTLVNSKNELLSFLMKDSFDVLVSNGCPYILPVGDLPPARYVNIHPSLLPDLRGVDPVIGAILFERDSGATCHIMDEGIDTGAIISSVRIPFTNDLNVTTLYQLSFMAEKEVFIQAFDCNFAPKYKQQPGSNDIYYSRNPSDQEITFSESNDFLLQKIKAFNNRSQGCFFRVDGQLYRVYSAQRLNNSYLLKLLDKFPDCAVALSYENSIVFRKDGEILRFSDIENNDRIAISIGTILL